VSIFVNPAQFSPTEDLAVYPRTLASDLAKLEEHGQIHAVFAPSVATMYPFGIQQDPSKQQGAFVEVVGLSHQLEGKIRPHFFRGVATVMTRMLNIVSPDLVMFGQKDIQQTVIMKRLLADLHFPTELVVCPTVREEDGLAMSSRNAYLSPPQRDAAVCLYRGLQTCQHLFQQDGVLSAGELVRMGRKAILDHASQAAAGAVTVEIEYFSLSDQDTLVDVETIDPVRGAIVSGAVRLTDTSGQGRDTRIIDNVILKNTSLS
jgi:pantoate--beta-alanine ligase